LHQFRDRNPEKDIQPIMKFKTRNNFISTSKNNTQTLPSISQYNMSMTQKSSYFPNDESEEQRPKLYFKSAHSLLLSVGSLKPPKSKNKDDNENLMARYDRILAELSLKGNKAPKPIKKELECSESSIEEEPEIKEDEIIAALGKKVKASMGGTLRVKHFDPILNVAEKVLQRCGVVERKKNMRYGGAGRRTNMILNIKELLGR